MCQVGENRRFAGSAQPAFGDCALERLALVGGGEGKEDCRSSASHMKSPFTHLLVRLFAPSLNA